MSYTNIKCLVLCLLIYLRFSPGGAPVTCAVCHFTIAFTKRCAMVGTIYILKLLYAKTRSDSLLSVHITMVTLIFFI